MGAVPAAGGAGASEIKALYEADAKTINAEAQKLRSNLESQTLAKSRSERKLPVRSGGKTPSRTPGPGRRAAGTRRDRHN